MLVPRRRLISSAVFGLGNVGSEYANTRHNVGFMVLDRFAAHHGLAFGSKPKNGLVTCRFESDVLLGKPHTYMNVSGPPVAAACRYYKVPSAATLVVVDCMALEVGTMRWARGGGHAGHNGIKSVVKHLGTHKFPRLRVGIGRPKSKNKATADFVVEPFSSAEEVQMRHTLARASQAIEFWIRSGYDVDATMNEFN